MKVVWVRWQDAAFISSSWQGADELGEHTAFQLLSAGLLVWENKEGIWLATDYAPDDNTYRYTCFIPKRLIIARGDVEVGKDALQV